MPKLERWLVAQKMVEVLDGDTLKELVDMGVRVGGGWARIHQHIMVTAANKEKAEALLREKGYEVVEPCNACHPETMPHSPPHGHG